MDTKEILSDNIRRFRLKRGLTQRELAERLGVSAKTVSKWETGRGVPDTLQLVPLVGALAVSLNQLLLEPAPPPPRDPQDRFGCIVDTYGISLGQVALAAGITEQEAEAALRNDFSGLSREKTLAAGVTLALLSETIPLFAEKNAVVLSHLLARLRDEFGIRPETLEQYAALPPDRLRQWEEEGKALTPREEERLLIVLFALERLFAADSCFPWEYQ